MSAPLPPAVRIGDLTVRAHPIDCWNCGVQHQAQDFEETAGGLRLVRKVCGADILLVSKGGDNESDY